MEGWSGFGEAPSSVWTAAAEPPEDVSARPRFSEPLLTGGSLYVVEAYVPGTMVEDPGGHQLQARDPATGDLEWSYELPVVPGAPAVWGDLVVVPAEETLYALDREAGTERWTRGFDSNAVSVLPGGDLAYVRVARTEGAEGSVVALAQDGTESWVRDFDRELFTGPTVGPGHVFAGANDGTVFALDREEGSLAWSVETPQVERPSEYAPYVYSITVTDCGVFVVTDEDVEAFTEDGQFVWRGEGDYRELATDGDTVFGSTVVDDDSVVRALDAVSGEQHWETAADLDTYAPAVVTDAEVYARSADGLLALDPDDGDVLWQYDGPDAAPTFADGTLYVTEGDPGEARLVALS